MVLNGIIDFGLSLFAVIILYKFLDIFFLMKKPSVISTFLWGIYLGWQMISTLGYSFSAYFNIVMVIILTISISIASCYGSIWKKYVFSISFNAIAMLLEIVCGYIFMTFGIDYMIPQTIGACISKSLLFMIVIALGKVFRDIAVIELPQKYTFLILLIPVGSIYIISNIFFLSSNQNNYKLMIQSMLSSFIMLGINIIVFFVYKKVANDTELRRLNTVYKQQMDLYDQHMREKEMSMLQFRNARHDLKQKLFILLNLAEKVQAWEIIDYVQKLIDESGVEIFGIARSGNSVIDTLINYKYSIAQGNNILFRIDLNIPIKWTFSGTDICVILGNALDNAIEATSKVIREKRNIRLSMHYIQTNLSIVIINSYDGNIRKNRNGKLLTTKDEPLNHGMGLQSIQKAVEKYQGVFKIDYSTDEFCLKLLLYGQTR